MRKQNTKVPKFNIEQLKYEKERKKYTEELEKELNAIKPIGKLQWESVKDSNINAVKKTVGIS